MQRRPPNFAEHMRHQAAGSETAHETAMPSAAYDREIFHAVFTNDGCAEGMELKEALVQAGLVRLRAILVTVLATVGGLIPLNLTGGELWRPLTGVHIFGLLCATSLTLVVLPVLYYIFCAKLRWIK